MRALVAAYGRDPLNPWAVDHALLALGPDMVLTNDRPAVDWFFEEYAVKEGLGVGFPASRGDIRIEPHTDLTLKSLIEQGIGPDRAVTVQGEATTVGALYRQSLCGAWVDGDQVSYGTWNDSPWALQALASWAPEDLAWTADGGHRMTLDAFTTASVAKLREETAFLREARANGAPVQKRRQGIFAYSCGGAHFVQGAAHAVARGFGAEGDRALITEEVGLHLWRMDLELAAVDQGVQQAPQYTVILTVQRLKFLGHLLETVHKAAAIGVFTPDEAQRAQLARASGELVRTFDALEATGVFERLDELKASPDPQTYQTYLDIIGDSAHAVRGIDLSTGEGGVWL